MVILPPYKVSAIAGFDEFSFGIFSDMKISYSDTIKENINMGHKQDENNLCIYKILVLNTMFRFVFSIYHFIFNTRNDGHGLE